MNKEERQELRENHRREKKYCAECGIRVNWSWAEFIPQEYPCEVIKVLDAYERLLKDLGKILYRE